eukprot:795721-Rhodomonas_salina.1
MEMLGRRRGGFADILPSVEKLHGCLSAFYGGKKNAVELAVAMGLHSRLGACGVISLLDDFLVYFILRECMGDGAYGWEAIV